MKLDPVLKEYAARFAEHGDTAMGHGWGSESSEVARRLVLLPGFNLPPFTALDFGCGTGDFSEDLATVGMTEYTGVEAVASIREKARQRFPQHRFVEFLPVSGTWDYVFVSGTFNLKTTIEDDDWENWVGRQVVSLWSRTRIAMIMNFLTYVPDWREDDLWYPDSPKQIVDWVKPPGYQVLRNYGLHEWTLKMTR